MSETTPGEQNRPDSIDWTAALQATDGDEELLLEIVKMFLDEAPSALSAIRRAMDEGDAKLLRVSAHKLKGSLRIFGSPNMAYDYARQLEQISLKPDRNTQPVEAVTSEDWARAAELCDLLREELQPILAIMKERAEG